MKPLIILDAGHGGLNSKGDYVTDPHKRQDFNPYQINEGVLNRAVVYGLSLQLDFRGINNFVITSNDDDTLVDRCRCANAVAKGRSAFFLSIHHNSFTDSSVTGTEFFTYEGYTPESDKIAQWAGKMFSMHYDHKALSMPDFRKLRIDKTALHLDEHQAYYKKANFAVLRATTMPAVLSEWGFMSNKNEFDYIASPKGINDQIRFWLHVIEAAMHNKYI